MQMFTHSIKIQRLPVKTKMQNVAYKKVVLQNFFKFILRQTEREREQGRGTERERERIPSRLC